MYRGRWQLGEEKALGVLTFNAAGVPTWPDQAPQVDFYGSAGKIASLGRSLPALERAFNTGTFQGELFLDNQAPIGLMKVVYRWTVGSFFGSVVDVFEVIPGGDSKGYVLALDDFSRPQADFLIQELSSGRLRAGRNPRL
jgi:hypothetical protein